MEKLCDKEFAAKVKFSNIFMKAAKENVKI